MDRIKLINELIDAKFNKSQVEFAKAIGKSPAQVNQWLTGYRSIGDGTARAIEMTLNLPAGWMDDGKGAEINNPTKDEIWSIYDNLDDKLKKVFIEQARMLKKLSD